MKNKVNASDHLVSELLDSIENSARKLGQSVVGESAINQKLIEAYKLGVQHVLDIVAVLRESARLLDLLITVQRMQIENHESED